MIWAECPLMNGAHIAEDAVLWELLDPETGLPVASGEVGELVVTDLVSTGAPLIRYRLRDLARIDTAPCGCGRTSARFVGGLLGRSDDMVTIRSANLYPSAIDAVVKSIAEPQIDDYQLVVDRPHELDVAVLRIQFRETPPSAVLERVRSELASAFRIQMGGRIDIVVVEPGSLPVFTYKAMRLIDRRKGQSEEQAAAIALQQSGAH
jgi:phenylacetate-CoA ligase